MVNYVLFEAASGYALFEVLQAEEIGARLEEVQKSIEDLGKFGKTVKLKSFLPFKNAAHALENANDISEGVVNSHLKALLEMNLPKSKSKSKGSVILGIVDKNLASSVTLQLGYECDTGELVLELVRGIRLHADKLLGGMKEGDLVKAQLGLGHSYSRAKVKFNVNRADNMIIQAISLLDQLDKDINTFAMRVREWYSWHFPELTKIVNDNFQYARLAKSIKNKSSLTEDDLETLEEITDDPSKAQQILDAARFSMGTDISDVDMLNIEHFADRVISLADYRKKLQMYLHSKMGNVAPNLSALIGDVMSARLISHAGSLSNLSKYPASTVQILGAEKALFRALKTKGNTPKYGLLFHSTYIGKAGTKNKGKISRFLANKCSIASRIDCFSDKPTSKYGEALKEQVEQRLLFFENGATPLKNEEVMQRVMASVAEKDAVMDVDEDSPYESDESSIDEEIFLDTGKEAESPTRKRKLNVSKESKDTIKKVAKHEEASDVSSSKKKGSKTPEGTKKKKEKTPEKKKTDANTDDTPKKKKKSKDTESTSTELSQPIIKSKKHKDTNETQLKLGKEEGRTKEETPKSEKSEVPKSEKKKKKAKDVDNSPKKPKSKDKMKK